MEAYGNVGFILPEGISTKDVLEYELVQGSVEVIVVVASSQVISFNGAHESGSRIFDTIYVDSSLSGSLNDRACDQVPLQFLEQWSNLLVVSLLELVHHYDLAHRRAAAYYLNLAAKRTLIAWHCEEDYAA